jgi:glucokinase
MEVLTLVADVGGTRSRLGLAQNGILDQTTVRGFANANFTSFYEVISEYLKDSTQETVESCVVALAGPISAGRGTLTNLNWEISIDGLRQYTQCHEATLINDLTSLGYCISILPTDGIQPILGPITTTVDNGQSLVVGLGTGFNVCPVLMDRTGCPVCLQVELGHTLLPYNIKKALSYQFDSSVFNTVEDVFSGKGLSNIYQAFLGPHEGSSERIVTDHLNGTDPNATKAVDLFAELLGKLIRELAIQYLPTAGIYFAGSVSRGIFEAGTPLVFERAMLLPDHFLENIDQIPIGLITDDAAGLLGCSQRSLWV